MLPVSPPQGSLLVPLYPLQFQAGEALSPKPDGWNAVSEGLGHNQSHSSGGRMAVQQVCSWQG